MFTKCSMLGRRGAAVIIIMLGVILAAAVILCSRPRDLFPASDIIDVSTAAGREKYLASYGWDIDLQSEESRTVLLPKSFGAALKSYADMQTAQGYDFAHYAGCECRQYVYRLSRYKGYDGTVYAVLYIKGSRVIGGDIHSSAIDGFMKPLR